MPAGGGSTLTLAIDPGDGTFRYSDFASQAGANEWRVLSFQAVLNTTGGARFALFNTLRSPAGRAEPVQMSGAVVVALVGTRFTGNVGLASGAGIA